MPRGYGHRGSDNPGVFGGLTGLAQGLLGGLQRQQARSDRREDRAAMQDMYMQRMAEQEIQARERYQWQQDQEEEQRQAKHKQVSAAITAYELKGGITKEQAQRAHAKNDGVYIEDKRRSLHFMDRPAGGLGGFLGGMMGMQGEERVAVDRETGDVVQQYGTQWKPQGGQPKPSYQLRRYIGKDGKWRQGIWDPTQGKIVQEGEPLPEEPPKPETKPNLVRKESIGEDGKWHFTWHDPKTGEVVRDDGVIPGGDDDIDWGKRKQELRDFYTKKNPKVLPPKAFRHWMRPDTKKFLAHPPEVREAILDDTLAKEKADAGVGEQGNDQEQGGAVLDSGSRTLTPPGGRQTTNTLVERDFPTTLAAAKKMMGRQRSLRAATKEDVTQIQAALAAADGDRAEAAWVLLEDGIYLAPEK